MTLASNTCLSGEKVQQVSAMNLLIICRKSDTILQCSGSALNGSFVGFWDWVKEAEYSGRRNETGVTLDFWKSTVRQKHASTEDAYC